MVQLSYLYMTTGKNIALTIWTFCGKVMSLLLIWCLGLYLLCSPWATLPRVTQNGTGLRSITKFGPCNLSYWIKRKTNLYCFWFFEWDFFFFKSLGLFNYSFYINYSSFSSSLAHSYLQKPAKNKNYYQSQLPRSRERKVKLHVVPSIPNSG